MSKNVMKQHSIVSLVVTLAILIFAFGSAYAETPVFGPEEMNAINSAQTNAEQLYRQLAPNIGKEKAMAQVVAYLRELPQVEDAGISDGGISISIKYTNGVEGSILTNPPGTRGGSVVLLSEELFVEAVKSTPIQKFDPTLPAVSMLRWVNSVAIPHSDIVWEVNDCGEQTGTLADKGRDFPACVEAIFLVAPEIQAHVSFMVGTFQQGVIGQPELFQLYVKQGGEYREVGKLSEIALIAK